MIRVRQGIGLNLDIAEPPREHRRSRQRPRGSAWDLHRDTGLIRTHGKLMNQNSDDIRNGYDQVAREYADRFDGELQHKPLDRELLSRFAAEVRGKGKVYDLGCGHGETTASLRELGVDARGLDLSAKLLEQAALRYPGVEFEQGNMLALPCPDEFLAGAVGFYSIVHFSVEDLRVVFTEIHRALRPGGRLLLSYHIGQETLRVTEFLGRDVTLDFSFFDPELVSAQLTASGFSSVETIEREPYPDVEYPSRRAYVFASKTR